MSLNALSICRTSLHYACAHNHPDVVTLLLENNSSINIRDDEGCTPLIKVAIGHLFWHEMDRGCPCLVSLAVIKHWPKTTQERKWLFGLHLHITDHSQGEPGQELKSGTGGKNWTGVHRRMQLFHGFYQALLRCLLFVVVVVFLFLTKLRTLSQACPNS